MCNGNGPCGLEAGGIAVWVDTIDLEEDEVRSFAGLLSKAELTRAARYRFERDRRRYKVRHGILRQLLARYLNCAAPKIEIRSDEKGKPHAVDRTQAESLQFSLSHSAGMAVFAFTRATGIGIDIERISGFPEMQAFAEMNFTPVEIRELDDGAEGMRLETFFKLWARKEAVLKASGDGLAVPLNRVDVSSPSGFARPWVAAKIEGECPAREFRFKDLPVVPGFAVALATLACGPPPTVEINWDRATTTD